MVGGIRWTRRVAGSAIVFFALSSPALAQPYTTVKPSVTVGPQAVADCADPVPTITVGVGDFDPSETVLVQFGAGLFTLTITVNATGSGSKSFLATPAVVPDLIPPEVRFVVPVTATGQTSRKVATTELVVLGCEAGVLPPGETGSPQVPIPPSGEPLPPPSLPTAGWGGQLLLRFGVVAVAVGTALSLIVVWSRRRRVTTT